MVLYALRIDMAVFPPAVERTGTDHMSQELRIVLLHKYGIYGFKFCQTPYKNSSIRYFSAEMPTIRYLTQFKVIFKPTQIQAYVYHGLRVPAAADKMIMAAVRTGHLSQEMSS